MLHSWFFLFLLAVSSAVPKPEETQHFTNGAHNKQYDHEAFLGQDAAKTFDQLSPEESKRRLGIIVDKIDTNKDSFISREELKDWIQYTQKRYILDDVNRQWNLHNTDGKDSIEWDDYKKMVYGFLSEEEINSVGEEEEDEEGFSYRNMYKRDKRRWATADQNNDGRLNKEEFSAFLHPEENPRMRDVIVLETLEDVDKDKDGKVSLKEYIGDMYRGDDGDPEPEWVKNEREQFTTYRDKNGDGYMDAEEVQQWLHPTNFDHAEAEANHLVYEADADADHLLTKEEILQKYDLFVGSQATDFGEALTRHDEF